MPLLKIQTSVQPEPHAVADLLKHLSAQLAQHLGKPESYVMTAFEAGLPMTFGGTTEPTCYVEIKSIGSMNPQQTQTMSRELCQALEAALGVSKARIYIEFADAKGSMWGWNGTTFG
ncbi:MAG TPA: phenylpyruvate tautomerase MIF-related protein [Stenomitos sp.]